MKIRFNRLERVAGLFVLLCVFGALLSMALVAVEQSWFESRTNYYTEVEKAEGLYPGTKVKMAGLKVGRVERVILSDELVKIEFSVLDSFASRIKTDSEIVMSRPFLLGEKVIDISVGGREEELLPAGSKIATSFSFDLMDMMNPRSLAPHFETLGKLAENLKFVAEAFLNRERTEAFVEMFDELKPLLKNANMAAVEVQKISHQLTHNKNLKVVMQNMALTTTELNKEIETMMSLTRQLPQITSNTSEVMKNLAELTKHMNQFLPAMKELAPHLPKASRRAMEAMDEAVVVLKAMQKSFMLRSAVEEVRKEELQRKRIPAGFQGGD